MDRLSRDGSSLRSNIAARFLRVRNATLNELPLRRAVVAELRGANPRGEFVITESKLKAKIWRRAAVLLAPYVADNVNGRDED